MTVKAAAVLLLLLSLDGATPATPPVRDTPPDPRITAALRDRTYLHLVPLPLGRFSGVIAGNASFDASSSRAVFLAMFPAVAVDGDWRKINPTQAFLLDVNQGSLTQLTEDGDARSVAWVGKDLVALNDAGMRRVLKAQRSGQAGPHRRGQAPPLHFKMVGEVADGAADVTPPDVERIIVYRNPDGTHALHEIGARVFRIAGVAPRGSFALVGSYVAWIDKSKTPGAFFARFGADNANVPNFTGSAYADALAPIMPLGRSVYQGAYRNGVAYFALSYGLRRIVAATTDLVNFTFPAVPREVIYTTGDGLGAGADGILYLARPEDLVIQHWKNGRYVRLPMRLPGGMSDERPLIAAMERMERMTRVERITRAGVRATGDIPVAAWPPLHPDQDVLDSALLEWRIYPLGDETGPAWIASYLGHVIVSDAAGRFVGSPTPAFPFAVLGRTDDGRIWGAAPRLRTVNGPLVSTATSSLWSTRDGSAWRFEAQLDGDAGAVGLAHRVAWVAVTRPFLGRPTIAVARLDSTAPVSAITGGSYAGEQLFFTTLKSGFYLIWGATPGTRLGSEQGTLSAFKVDSSELFASSGFNSYMQERLSSMKTAGSTDQLVDLFRPTLTALRMLGWAQRPTLVTNVAPQLVMSSVAVAVQSPDSERQREVMYAERPYPIARIEAKFATGEAILRRTLELGPLAASGTMESWNRGADGSWHLRSILSRWEY